MKKFVCTVCGYVYEGETAPEVCPVCKAPASKFKEQSGEKTWAAEHVVGVAKGVPEDILADLRANFEGECSEVGMYLAMARVAHREGYPEIGLYRRHRVRTFFALPLYPASVILKDCYLPVDFSPLRASYIPLASAYRCAVALRPCVGASDKSLDLRQCINFVF